MESKNLNPMQLEVAKPENQPVAPPAARKRSGGGARLLVILLFLVAGGVALFLALKRGRADSQPEAQAITTVAVVKAERQDLYNDVPIPAEFRPYVQSELHALVTGYVDQMNVDFGDRVKQGQVLATIEVPELLDQLHNAMATQQQAQADYEDADLIYQRLLGVSKANPKLVAQQDLDNAKAREDSTAAQVAAAKANVQKFQTLMNYTKIVAPFDGVITQRSVDPGALVQAGTSSDRSQSVVRVSDNYHLRLDFPVSVEYARDVHVGDSVTVRVDSLGGKLFTGKITRFTDKVNEETRTMMTELEVDNPDLEIIPGMYAVVMFKFERRPDALAIPIEAVSDPKDPTIYVINPSHEIEARQVKLGIETANHYEVTGGLKEGELVMIGNRTQVHPGQTVEPKIVQEPAIP